MEIPKPSPSEPAGKNPKLEFEEFRDFLQTELGSPETNVPRRVVALSEGLGLESPKRTDTPLKTELAPQPTQPAAHPPPPIRKGTPLSPDDLVRMEPPQNKGSRLASVMDAPPPRPKESTEEKIKLKREVETLLPSQETKVKLSTPPLLKSPSGIKRLLSTLLDVIFGTTLFLVALVVSVNIATGFEAGFSLNVIRHLTEPQMIRITALEYMLAWAFYMMVAVGFGNRTFGMWVWGIRISYGNPQDDTYLLRRCMRAFWSTIFYATLLPLPFLAIRRKGKNLLDLLSGSNLYGSV